MKTFKLISQLVLCVAVIAIGLYAFAIHKNTTVFISSVGFAGLTLSI